GPCQKRCRSHQRALRSSTMPGFARCWIGTNLAICVARTLMDCSTPFTGSAQVAAGAVEILPAVALFHDGFEIFLPDHAVLHGIFHHGADHAAREIGGAKRTVAEMRCETQ